MLTYQQKNTRYIIIASIILLALLAVIAFVFWSDTRQARALLPPSPTDFKRIGIQRPGFDDIQINLDSNNQWQIEEPCHLPANSQRLQPLFGFANASAHAYDVSEVDMEAAGLLNPQAVLMLDDLRIEIGNTDLSGERRYIRRNQQVEFAPEWLLSLLNGGLTALANLEVFPTSLASINLQDDTGKHKITIQPVSEWQSLTAQQIVEWPIAGDEPLLDTLLLNTLQDGKTASVSLFQYATFTAIVRQDSTCAFLLPNGDVPVTPAP